MEIRALHQLATVHFGIGRFADARRLYLEALARSTASGRPWSPWGLDARAVAALAAYILGDWDDVLSITDTSAEAPPPLAEAYLHSVSLDVEAGRGMAEALDHIAAVRPFWERDGAMVLYCTTAAIDLTATGATSRRRVTSTTSPSRRCAGCGRAASCGSGCG